MVPVDSHRNDSSTPGRPKISLVRSRGNNPGNDSGRHALYRMSTPLNHVYSANEDEYIAAESTPSPMLAIALPANQSDSESERQ